MLYSQGAITEPQAAIKMARVKNFIDLVRCAGKYQEQLKSGLALEFAALSLLGVSLAPDMIVCFKKALSELNMWMATEEQVPAHLRSEGVLICYVDPAHKHLPGLYTAIGPSLFYPSADEIARLLLSNNLALFEKTDIPPDSTMLSFRMCAALGLRIGYALYERIIYSLTPKCVEEIMDPLSFLDGGPSPRFITHKIEWLWRGHWLPYSFLLIERYKDTFLKGEENGGMHTQFLIESLGMKDGILYGPLKRIFGPEELLRIALLYSEGDLLVRTIDYLESTGKSLAIKLKEEEGIRKSIKKDQNEMTALNLIYIDKDEVNRNREATNARLILHQTPELLRRAVLITFNFRMDRYSEATSRLVEAACAAAGGITIDFSYHVVPFSCKHSMIFHLRGHLGLRIKGINLILIKLLRKDSEPREWSFGKREIETLRGWASSTYEEAEQALTYIFSPPKPAMH